MQTPLIHPVILSGGSGSRLWPLSRASYPKQLLALVGEQTLIQQTLLRAEGVAGAQPPIIICNSEHRFLIRSQCQAIGCQPAAIWLEPVGRNTAPAIALAALQLAAVDPNAIMLVLSADHVIDDQAAFNAAVAVAAEAAQQGYLLTFGIAPNAPETGYGYIKTGDALSQPAGAYRVARFVEKPDAVTAQQYLDAGGYLWNSGMFVFTAQAYLDELARFRPDMLAAMQQAYQQRQADLSFLRPGEAFASSPSDSIDYAVMQATQQAAVVPAGFGWSDVGSWESLWQIAAKDAAGNALHGDVYVANTRNSLVRAESRLVAVIGLEDVVVVETADAVLVMHKDQSQAIKQAIQQFDQQQRRVHIDHLRVHRPWGWYEGIDAGSRFKVKRIMVSPGEKLSLQMHHHRAEHWVVVSGTAQVTVDGDVRLIAENQSTYIPLGQSHRLENPGRIPLHMIEVQSGAYLEEDDIVRFADDYHR